VPFSDLGHDPARRAIFPSVASPIQGSRAIWMASSAHTPMRCSSLPHTFGLSPIRRNPNCSSRHTDRARQLSLERKSFVSRNSIFNRHNVAKLPGRVIGIIIHSDE